MAQDRYAKLELQIRVAFRQFWTDSLASGKSRPILLPAFDIPRGETVDLFLGPKEGTTLCLVQRSDYVTVYRHTIGQLVGILAHYQTMTERQLREAVRTSKGHSDVAELKQPRINVLNVSRRLADDRERGHVTLALVTELPDVAPQAVELAANFLPVVGLLRPWMVGPVKRKKLCKALELFSVELGEVPVVHPMEEAITKLAKKGS